MAKPRVALGVTLMDDDHAALEVMLGRVATAADGDLPALLGELEAETRAHFAREEEMMRACKLPILHCHIAQHEMLLAEFRHGHAARDAGDLGALRHFLGETLATLVAAHIESVDMVSASFLRRETSEEALSCLRLPVPAEG